MSTACLFSGLYCQADQIVKSLSEKLSARIVTDADVAELAAELSGMTEAKISKAFSASTSVFNKFSHDKERAVSWLRLAVATMLNKEESIILHGYSSHLPPDSISHLLRTCLISSYRSRIDAAESHYGISGKQAQREIQKSDEDRAAWVRLIRGASDPWAKELYDLIAPVDKLGADEVCELIAKNLDSETLKRTKASQTALADFLLAARVETALASAGHHVNVQADKGKATVIINRNVLMLERLERELKEVAQKVDGVSEVETRVGPGFHQTDIYRKIDFELPSKVLLVDDERDFVQTLSERLMLRDMGSAVAYNGESALDIVDTDEPEVIVLDLKMPGIDGIEVLRRIKEKKPSIEVIILTGHGTEKDREICMQLGAFAYLHKPVDIETLSKTIKQAHEKAGVVG